MTTEDKDLQTLLEENNRLQKQAVDLLLNMRRTQMVRFGISILIIALPLIAAYFALPRFVDNTIDQLALTNSTQGSSIEQLN
jgi:hypothetical protein